MTNIRYMTRDPLLTVNLSRIPNVRRVQLRNNIQVLKRIRWQAKDEGQKRILDVELNETMDAIRELR